MLTDAYLCIAWEIPPLLLFSDNKTISISVSSSNFTWVIFKHAFNAKPGVVQKYGGSNLHSFKQAVLNYSKVSANWVVSDWT